MQENGVRATARGRMAIDPSTMKFGRPKSHLKYEFSPGSYHKMGWLLRRIDGGTLVKVATCSICGREDESGFHAMIRCTKTRALRYELRKHWLLPEEEMLTNTGPDWLLLLLSALDEAMKANVSCCCCGEHGT
jgi:hypothetical protein